MIGDVVGKAGRRAVSVLLPKLKQELDPDIIIANGENAAGGLGLTRDTALSLFAFGIDVITLGNHTWAKKDVADFMDKEPRIIRPANYPPGAPGRGYGIFTTQSGAKVGVINLLGRIFMDPVDCPFRTADDVVEAMQDETDVVIVDIHAEATSEKAALGWHLDGRVSAVLGTHTHVQTSDQRVLPCGTAFITDVGMVGPKNSILGLDVQTVVTKFITRLPNRFEPAEGPAVLSAVSIEIDDATGLAVGIERISIREG